MKRVGLETGLANKTFIVQVKKHFEIFYRNIPWISHKKYVFLDDLYGVQSERLFFLIFGYQKLTFKPKFADT
jgi:hypothetical protein